MSEELPPEGARRELLLALVVDLLGQLLRAAPEQVDAAVDQALRRLGVLCDVDRSYVFRHKSVDGAELIDNTHEWCADGIAATIHLSRDLPGFMIDPWRERLLNDLVINIPVVTDLPDTSPEKAHLLHQGIQSLIAVPIRTGGRFAGFVGFDAVRSLRRFRPDETVLLKSIADGIGAALARSDDATRIAEAQASLAEVHDRLRTTLGALRELVIEVDGDGRYRDVHTADPGQMMVPPERLIGRTHEEAMPPDIAALNRRAMAEVDAQGQSGPHHFWAETPRGRRRYALTVTPRPPHRPGGRPGYVFVSRDITEEWHLAREAERLGLIARRMTDLVMMIGLDSRIEWVNPAFEARTGWSLAELRGRSPAEVLHAEETDRDEVARIDAAMVAGQAVRAELLNRSRDGKLFWTEIDMQPLHDADGVLTGYVSIETDITERKAQAAALERLAREATEARNRLETAVEGLPDAFSFYDAEDRLVLCNRRHRELYPGIAHLMVPGASFEMLLRAGVASGDIVVPDGDVDALLKQRLDAHRTAGRSVERQLRNGTIQRVLDFATADGGRVAMAIDITELKAAEQRLAEIIDAAEAGTWELDLATDSKRVNDRWAGMLGYTPDELAGRPHFGFRDLVHPGDLAMLLEQHEAVLGKGGDRFANEIRMRHKAGHWVWLLSRGRVVQRDAHGEPQKLAGIHLDITDRMQLQAQLTAERDYLARLMDTSASGIAALDAAGHIIYANREAENILGLSASQIKGMSYDMPEWQITGLDGAPFDPAELPFSRVMAEDRTVRDIRHAIVWPDGTRRALSINAAPIRAEGLAVRVVCSIRDITAEIAAQEALRRAAERAEAANRAKSHFLANMSHEIRTPLNGVLGMAEVLEAELSEPKHRDMLATIRASGESLLGVLNDVLDMSKIEAGKLSLEHARFVPAELLARVEAMHRLQARSKGLEFEVRVGQDAQRPRWGDPVRLTQILHNLLSNAVKFTEAGGVAVSLDLGPDDQLELTVRDTGIGMTADQLARVFDEFEQADGTVTRRFGGTGLGMSIVRRLVDLMKGEISIESAVGQGSVIRIRLPLPEAEAAEPDQCLPAEPALAGLRVLAADDNRTNLQVLRAMLAGLGVEVVTAPDGRAALQEWQAGRFDLYLLDISMPELDGISTLSELRRREAAAGCDPAPALAITANAMAHQVAEYREAGFCDHLAKPFRRAELGAALFRARTSRSS